MKSRLKGFTSLIPKKPRQAISEHPGHAIHTAIGSTKTSHSIFIQAVRDLCAACDAFEQASVDRKLFGRPFRVKYEQVVLAISKELFSACSAAMALVDHTRNVKDTYPIADYDSQRKETFGDEHEFIQCLRNYVNHNRTAPLAWRQHWDFSRPNPRTVFSLVKRKLLLTSKKWTVPAQRYVSLQPEEINVRALFE
jgi:hypothetical protein